MALSIDAGTRTITVPKADLTFVSGTLYTLDTEAFRLEMNELIASVNYIWLPDYATRNAPVTVSGTTFAQTLELINSFSVEFDDTSGTDQYSVQLEGSNNNIFDIQSGILVQNLIQVIPTNSAGLIQVQVGSGVTAQDIEDIVDGVWDEQTDEHTVPGSFGKFVVSSLLTVGKFLGLK